MNAHAQANSESFLDSAVEFVRSEAIARGDETQAAQAAQMHGRSFQLSIDAGAPAPFPLTLGEQSPSSPGMSQAHLQIEVKAAAGVTFIQRQQFVDSLTPTN